MKKTFLALAVILMAGMLIIGGCDLLSGGGNQATPEETIKAFMKAMVDKDADTLATLTGEEIDAADLEGESIKSYTIGEIKEVSDTEATAMVKIVVEEDEMEMTFDLTFTLNNVDGSWFVDPDPELDFDWDDMDFDFDMDDWDDEDWDLDWDDEDWDLDWDEDEDEDDEEGEDE